MFYLRNLGDDFRAFLELIFKLMFVGWGVGKVKGGDGKVCVGSILIEDEIVCNKIVLYYSF